MAGFDFLQLPLLSTEIERMFFPANDPTISILSLYGTFSLSLLARFFGSVFFSGIASKQGITKIIKWIIPSISVLMLLSSFFMPTVYSEIYDSDYANFLPFSISPLLFIASRMCIGFLMGGLWPNLAVFGLEEYFRIKFIDERGPYFEHKDLGYFHDSIKKYSIKSAFLQDGFHIGLLAEGLILFFIQDYSGTVYHLFRITSLIGAVFGFILILAWYGWNHHFNNKNKTGYPNHKQFYANSQYVNKSENGIKELFSNRKHRKALVNLWLILTGLFYMYYSTVIITPEFLYRDNIGNTRLMLILFWCVSIIGHIWLAIIWKFVNFYKNRQVVKPGSEGDKGKQGKSEGDLRSGKIQLELEQWKIKSILYSSLSLIPIGLFDIIFYYFNPGESNASIKIILHCIVILLANSGWAFILSILSGWFPKYNRYLASSIAYNGGLIISFASPFILMESQITTGIQFLPFIALIVGTLPILFGARRLKNSYLPHTFYFKNGVEIRCPDGWVIDKKTDENMRIDKDNASKIDVDKPIDILISNDNNKNKVLIYNTKEADSEKITKEISHKIMEYHGENKDNICLNNIHKISEKRVSMVSVMSYHYEYSGLQLQQKFFAYLIPKYGNNYIILYMHNLDSKRDNEVDKIIDSFDIKIPLIYDMSGTILPQQEQGKGN